METESRVRLISEDMRLVSVPVLTADCFFVCWCDARTDGMEAHRAHVNRRRKRDDKQFIIPTTFVARRVSMKLRMFLDKGEKIVGGHRVEITYGKIKATFSYIQSVYMQHRCPAKKLDHFPVNLCT